jgi:hypothetical protein
MSCHGLFIAVCGDLVFLPSCSRPFHPPTPPPHSAAQERIQQLNTELKQTRAQLKAAQESYENAAERSRETVREQIEAVRRECRAVEEHCKLELDQMRRTAVCEEGRLLPLPLSPTPFHPLHTNST